MSTEFDAARRRTPDEEEAVRAARRRRRTLLADCRHDVPAPRVAVPLVEVRVRPEGWPFDDTDEELAPWEDATWD